MRWNTGQKKFENGTKDGMITIASSFRLSLLVLSHPSLLLIFSSISMSLQEKKCTVLNICEKLF